MTFFQDDNGNTIEVDEDIQLYKSAVNLFNFEIKGNFSTSFQIPNNSYYRNAFQYFTPLQIPNNGFKATIFSMVRNGNIIERGQLVLERQDDTFLYLFFISGNANWITLIPDISVRDIDYDDYALEHKSIQITNLKSATSGFCYPLIDWGQMGNKAMSNYYSLNLDTSQDNYQSNFLEFYPCFFLKSAMQSIFKYCQLKIGGDILNDPVYNQMIITPDNGQITRADKFYTDRKVNLSNGSDSVFGKINLDTVLENGGLQCWNSSSQKYIANKSCQLNITLNAKLNISIYSEFVVKKNGSAYKTFLPQASLGFLTTANIQSSIINLQNIGTGLGVRNAATSNILIDVVTGDELEFYIDFGGTSKGNFNASGGSFPAGAAIGDWWTISVGGTIGGLHPVTVVPGDRIQSPSTGPGNDSLLWIVRTAATGFKVLSGSNINIEPRQYLNWMIDATGSSTGYDTLRASDILPDIKMIELIKFVSQYFCAIPTFDTTTDTVSFNKLDNYDYSQSSNWSEYLQKIENNFAIQTAKYNYIRFKDVDDSILKSIGSNNSLKYGDVLIQGQSSTKVTNDIFQFPFGSVMDRKSYVDQIQTPWIPLVQLEFDGNPIPIVSVVNSGSGTANINAASTDSSNQYVLIYNTNEYDGFIRGFFASNVFHTELPFTLNKTGYIQLLRFNFKSEQSRILFFTGSQNISSISTASAINFDSPTGSQSTIGYAYFSKPSSGYSISSYKQGLNLDYYQGGYTDIPRRLDYYKNLTRILNAPYVKGWFYLPDAVYASFNFDKFIYLLDEDEQRYYLVDSIENYKDKKTLCQVNLLLLP